MEVSRQHGEDAHAGGEATVVSARLEPEKGPRARTRRLMLDTATRLMQAGVTPSVSGVAEAAGVSRATAYRYFPSQAALVNAVVEEALGPILDWRPPPAGGAGAAMADLLASAMPRIDAFEATFRAALKLSLEQWAAARSAASGGEPAFTRGHRIDLIGAALQPLRGKIPAEQAERLAQALSLLFGIEALVVLKDIWGLDGDKAQDVIAWAGQALVSAAAGGQVSKEGAAPRSES